MAAESESSAQTYHYVPALEEYCKDEDFMGKYIPYLYIYMYIIICTMHTQCCFYGITCMSLQDVHAYVCVTCTKRCSTLLIYILYNVTRSLFLLMSLPQLLWPPALRVTTPVNRPRAISITPATGRGWNRPHQTGVRARAPEARDVAVQLKWCRTIISCGDNMTHHYV